MNTNGFCDRFEREGILRLERGLSLDAHFDACPTCEVARHKYETLLEALPSAQPDIEPAAGWQSRVLRATAAKDASRSGFSLAGWGKPFVWAALAGTAALASATFFRLAPAPQFEVQAETHASAPTPELALMDEKARDMTNAAERPAEEPLPAPAPVAPRYQPRQTAPVPRSFVAMPATKDDEAPVAAPEKPAPVANNPAPRSESVASATGQTPPSGRQARVVRPDKLYGLAIKYPPAAMKAKIQGETSVQCTIRADGRNTNCKILKGLPYLDNAVLKAVEAARSEPIRVDGKAVDNSDHIWHITITLREIVDDRTSARGLPTLNWN
ncbi:MAG TPA: TonB family protein [Polyangium sp.]|nr:TonB family protein [Polyangium sp.]